MRQPFTAIAATLLLTPAAALAQEAPSEGPLSMTRAIEAAQAQIDGGVLEAEIETEDGALIYEIDMVRDGEVYEVTIDAQSGEVLSQSEEQLTGFLSGLFQQDELRAAEAAGDSLLQTLTTLEGAEGAQIEELTLEEEDGRMVYEVEFTEAAGAREIMIDAATGERLSDAG